MLQNQTVANPMFIYLLFFFFFHTVCLFWLSKGMNVLAKFPKSDHYHCLLMIMVPSMLGLRVIQNSITPGAESNQYIVMISFYEAVIASCLGVYLVHAQRGFLYGLRRIVYYPLGYAVFIGFGFALFQYQPPYEVTDTISRLSAAAIPAAVIITGMAFGKSIYLIDFSSYIHHLPGALLCAALRLIVSPLMAWGIAGLMGIDNTGIFRAVVLAAGLPTGVFALVITGVTGKPEQHGFAALTVILTTILSFMTIPVLIYVLNHFYPL